MSYNTYTITLTNGSVLSYVSPLNADDTSCALTLVGQADLNYGVPLNENFVHLLENFANSAAPSEAPLQGQLYYNTTTGLLNLWCSIDSTITWYPLATQSWTETNFATFGTYATESWVEAYISAEDFVTQTYINDQEYLTANQTITLSGALTGSGTTSIVATLSPSGVTAGTYSKVAVNSVGLVTVGELLEEADVTTALGYTPVALTDFTESLTTPNGLNTEPNTKTDQWFVATITTGLTANTLNTSTISFPTAFATACLFTIASFFGNSPPAGVVIASELVSATQMTITMISTTTISSTSYDISVLAIGY